MKEKEEILKAAQEYMNKYFCKEDVFAQIRFNAFEAGVLWMKEQQQLPSSPLLCIEEKVIDEEIKQWHEKACEGHMESEHRFILGYVENIILELKSKMTPIDPVKIKSEAWDKAELSSRKNYEIGYGFNEENIRQDKIKYLNIKSNDSNEK